jgi:hypothetical protein
MQFYNARILLKASNEYDFEMAVTNIKYAIIS